MRIGTVKLDNPYILAPMAGVSDLPFRLLCKEQGAGMVCMEMISAKAITFRNKKTFSLMETLPQERPVSLQLFGNEPETMAEAARMIEGENFDILDINMGCPVPKVAGNGEGSALMKNPALAGEIVSRVAAATSRPVTVKIRKGFDEAHVNAVEVAKVCESAGAAAITVHGRTREQYYSGKADWEIIWQVKEAVRVPVIGNGDVVDPASAAEMIRRTGCDGVMVGRAARGNPWIFSRILAALGCEEDFAKTDGGKAFSKSKEDDVSLSRRTPGQPTERDSGSPFRQTIEGHPESPVRQPLGKDPGPPTRQEIVDMILRHLALQVQYKGEDMAVREMRKHIAWYTAGLPHSARLRSLVNTACSEAQIRELLKGVLA